MGIVNDFDFLDNFSDPDNEIPAAITSSAVLLTDFDQVLHEIRTARVLIHPYSIEFSRILDSILFAVSIEISTTLDSILSSVGS